MKTPEYDEYDYEMIEMDKKTGNFDGDLDNYRPIRIVQNSLLNGQFKQARRQCREYGLDYQSIKNDMDQPNYLI